MNEPIFGRCPAAGSLACVLILAVSFGAEAKETQAPALEEVRACYAENSKKAAPEALNKCLALEWRLVEAEHKDVTERVAFLAKALDKPAGTRTRWNKFIQAGQSFASFVNRECGYVRMTTKGSRTVENNAELSCRINYYRLRTDVLENRYLAGQR